jgi:1-acyl-sn-glycerol-3-phosphate acyltransferase
MAAGFYNLVKAAFAFPRLVAVRETILNPERADRQGPFILAVSHLSHLEPAFVSCLVKRHVRWMARIEHYNSRPSRTFLDWCGAFSVDRYGNAAPAVRQAIRLLEAGEVIGIFPEGGNATGQSSVLRNAPIKGGAATISIATQAPIIPVVVLGTHTLNAVLPWLPTKSNKVAIAFGPDVTPPKREPQTSRRAQRLQLTSELRTAFVATYKVLLTKASLNDSEFP